MPGLACTVAFCAKKGAEGAAAFLVLGLYISKPQMDTHDTMHIYVNIYVTIDDDNMGGGGRGRCRNSNVLCP